jgi:UDP-N-acetylmuramoyl-L-alanyl-D-glutamate--2,6-diaminopimelate ligase
MEHSCSLADLFAHFPLEVLSEIPDLEINGITADSRQVLPGNLFVAVKGGSFNGHDYILGAVAKGAAAVVGTELGLAVQVPYILVTDSHQALPHLAAAFYGFPARKLTVIGVTGTDGKTTTTNLIYQILLAAGIKAGMVSTVNAVIGQQVVDTGFHVTTPEPLDIQKYLADMVSAGLTHVVLEATSHGLSQYRVDACEFDLAVVTNITHEHLDYHASYENYRAAKGRLFTMLGQTVQKQGGNYRVAVLNVDDSAYSFLSDLTNKQPQVRMISYGLAKKADVYAELNSPTAAGLEFNAVSPKYRFSIRSHLTGLYNILNCLAAIAVTVDGMGIPWEYAQKGIANLFGIPGRMERIDLGQDFTAIVDFAHTPNALQVSLEAARQMTQGRVIAVFGSAGLRDRAKRRMMAETAIKFADCTVLTAEDPRTESLEMILNEMEKGAQSQGGIEGKTYWKIPNRGEAIYFAVNQARAGDVVIACGKGHEQSMCFGVTEYPWDDRIAMRSALAQKLGLPGPMMPKLPAS